MVLVQVQDPLSGRSWSRTLSVVLVQVQDPRVVGLGPGPGPSLGTGTTGGSQSPEEVHFQGEVQCMLGSDPCVIFLLVFSP